MDTIPSSPPGTQIPTLSYDLVAPTAPSAGWTVSHVWGGDGTSTFAKQFQDILNRTEAFPILSRLFYRPVVAVLVVVWSAVLWRKARSRDTALSWRDAVAVVVFAASVLWREMVVAIGFTAAYAAWSTLADRSWSTTGKLPGFDAFIASLRPIGEDPESSEAKPVTPAEPGSEAARIAQVEANLGLPEKKPEEDCVVCWSSDDSPLQLPCSHLVCEGCLTRLKEANRFLCPFCRRPLFSLATNKVHLFQLSVVSTGAQLALALVLFALRIAKRRYWGAAECFFFKILPAVATIGSQWEIRSKGEEGYFASTSESTLGVQLAFSLYMLMTMNGSVQEVDWATFVDGKWARSRPDEWQNSREFVCWLAPELAGKMLSC